MIISSLIPRHGREGLGMRLDKVYIGSLVPSSSAPEHEIEVVHAERA